jgi:putative radical SAM enzyme (TIGR03279 family)
MPGRRTGRGVLVEKVREGSAAEKAGVRAGDLLLKVEGRPVRDLIDYLYHLEGPAPELLLERGGRESAVVLDIKRFPEAGLELEHFRVRTCRNKCKFCFVSQLPKGLRRPLYVKDEDYRMSFLYGNYVTLAGLKDSDRRRIIRQHLSPLYVSVHATDPGLRNELLGNPKAPDIMQELGHFSDHGIRFHAQIVLCPGINDKAELKRTIRDLASLYPHIMSIAVVPVGLTAYHASDLRAVERADAEAAIDIIDAFAKKFKGKYGDPLVFAADELYLKARRAFPGLGHYGELHQIENGVGMVPLFRAEARRISPAKKGKGQSFLTFTGVSFYPTLKRFIDKLARKGITIEAVRVENALFGPSVTVAGLLTGRDVVKALLPHREGRDVLLVPDVVLRECDGVFLDDVTLEDVERELALEVKVVDSSPAGLMEGIV